WGPGSIWCRRRAKRISTLGSWGSAPRRQRRNGAGRATVPGEDCLRVTNGYWLFYGKAGGGWVGNADFTINNLTTGTSITASINNTNNGWLVGAGIEWAFAPNWSAKVEYSYLGLDDRTFIVPSLPGRRDGQQALAKTFATKERAGEPKKAPEAAMVVLLLKRASACLSSQWRQACRRGILRISRAGLGQSTLTNRDSAPTHTPIF